MQSPPRPQLFGGGDGGGRGLGGAGDVALDSVPVMPPTPRALSCLASGVQAMWLTFVRSPTALPGLLALAGAVAFLAAERSGRLPRSLQVSLYTQ